MADHPIAWISMQLSLFRWGVIARRAKGIDRRAHCDQLVDAICARSSRLDFGTHEQLCRKNRDAFDAVVAALAAGAVLLKLASEPNAAQRAVAAREGWIALPEGTLEELLAVSRTSRE